MANGLPKVVLRSSSLLAHTVLCCLQEVGDCCPSAIEFGMHVQSFSQAKGYTVRLLGRDGNEREREGEGEREGGKEGRERKGTVLRAPIILFNF